jgi:hypothetical protein
MARHFSGIANRIGQGDIDLKSPANLVRVASFLQQSGVSLLGAQQFLENKIVSNAGDRQRLARIINALLDLSAPKSVSEIALLLPAVQAAREAARSNQKLQELGLSAAGAHQLITGLPVTNAEDRQALGLLLIFTVSASPHMHKGGGYNELSLDDTAGKEK